MLDLECLHSDRGRKSFRLTGKVHNYAVSIRQLGMHFPLDQGESVADATVGSREVGQFV